MGSKRTTRAGPPLPPNSPPRCFNRITEQLETARTHSTVRGAGDGQSSIVVYDTRGREYSNNQEDKDGQSLRGKRASASSRTAAFIIPPPPATSPPRTLSCQSAGRKTTMRRRRSATRTRQCRHLAHEEYRRPDRHGIGDGNMSNTCSSDRNGAEYDSSSSQEESSSSSNDNNSSSSSGDDNTCFPGEDWSGFDRRRTDKRDVVGCGVRKCDEQEGLVGAKRANDHNQRYRGEDRRHVVGTQLEKTQKAEEEADQEKRGAGGCKDIRSSRVRGFSREGLARRSSKGNRSMRFSADAWGSETTTATPSPRDPSVLSIASDTFGGGGEGGVGWLKESSDATDASTRSHSSRDNETQDPGSEDSISLSSHLREGSSPEASFSAMRFTSEDPEDTPPSTSEGIDDGDNCNGFSSDIACGKASTLREFAGNGNANQEEDCGAPPATAKRAHRSSRDARGAAGDRCTTVRQRTQHDKRKSLAGRNARPTESSTVNAGIGESDIDDRDKYSRLGKYRVEKCENGSVAERANSVGCTRDGGNDRGGDGKSLVTPMDWLRADEKRGTEGCGTLAGAKNDRLSSNDRVTSGRGRREADGRRVDDGQKEARREGAVDGGGCRDGVYRGCSRIDGHENLRRSSLMLSYSSGHNSDMVQCVIVRDRSGLNRLYPQYRFFFEGREGHLVMVAQKCPKNRTSNYHVFDMQRGGFRARMSKKNGNYLGKVRANLKRTEATVFTKGQEVAQLGAIWFEKNGLINHLKNGSHPRKFTVLLPALSFEGAPVAHKVDPFDAESDMMSYVKNGRHGSMFPLRTRKPAFSRGVYRLNFNGRVTVPSVKNFQLVSPDDESHTVCQFGKVGDDRFHLDYRAPINAFQAFCIALAQFNF